MNFQNIPKVERASHLLDTAFRAAREAEMPDERARLRLVNATLSRHLKRTLKSFPSFDSLPGFYSELVRTTMDYPDLKKALAAIDWSIGRLGSLHRQYDRRAAAGRRVMREFYGRVSSVVKQIDPQLEYLDQCRRILRRVPDVKPGWRTVAIAGYPNVGKSSLLEALTDAKPEIKEYAFTTKSVNMGYIAGRRLQLIDTPGLFDRSRSNPIELQSIAVIRHLADLVVFVIDPTGSSGYSVREQRGLVQRLRDFGKPMLIVHAKSDMVEKRLPGSFYVSAKTGEGLTRLISRIP